jgi:hypothetical protein
VRLLDRDGGEVARLTLLRAKPLGSGEHSRAAASQGEPGIISGGTVSGVEILDVQPEGKRPMPLTAYRNGHRWDDGLRIESIA